nr:MAG TPA: hypothetical protein [Caudoviricetes sp.]
MPLKAGNKDSNGGVGDLPFLAASAPHRLYNLLH